MYRFHQLSPCKPVHNQGGTVVWGVQFNLPAVVRLLTGWLGNWGALPGAGVALPGAGGAPAGDWGALEGFTNPHRWLGCPHRWGGVSSYAIRVPLWGDRVHV